MTNNTFHIPNSIVLDCDDLYDPKILNGRPFKHVNDIVEGMKFDLGNMTSCYPFKINSVKWRSSEEPYLAGEFSNDTTIQEELRGAKRSYAATTYIPKLSFSSRGFM